MPLVAGTRLGVYEITCPLGAGGMGEVYRARDTRLNRDVAVKVLPEAFTLDGDRLARFEREAQVLASLNHPHIAQIYGIEESSGVRALVMELVEGSTLADRIKQGAIPIDEALPIATQLAQALEAAHEKGIIHRDLKPANIAMTTGGQVKVLDFGLAKTLEPPDAVPDVGPATNSPTLSMAATQAGVILGTAAYMAPEQARGKPADKRADIWAFGCVLYEMLTGRRAFDGSDAAEVLAAVLMKEPEWSILPGATPPRVRAVLQRCLRKERTQRARDIGDVGLALDGGFDSSGSEQALTAKHLPSGPWQRAVVPLVALCAGGAIAGGAVWLAVRPDPPRVVVTDVTTSGEAALSVQGTDGDLAMVPDGSSIVYRGRGRLFVRRLSEREPMALTTGGDPRGPFVSPDGLWVGYFDGGVLKKESIDGGPSVTITALVGNPRGATWGPDGIIVYATASDAGLQQVSAGGGESTILTTPEPEHDHVWPEFLPDGRGVLFTVVPLDGDIDAAQIALVDIRTGTHTMLLPGGSHARYVPTGHLVYSAAGALRAVPFDLATRTVTGPPVPVLDQVMTTDAGAVDVGIARTGTLAYVTGAIASAQRSLVWVDRAGREEAIRAPRRAYMYPSVAPDGTRISVHSDDQEHDLWVWDLGRETLTRLTFDPGQDLDAHWTPDGRRLFFSSNPRVGGALSLFVKPADGTGSAERLTESRNNQAISAVMPDGTGVLFHENVGGQRDLRLLKLTPTPTVESLLETRFDERGAALSPDGRWLAYESNSSGRFEIYVRPFPAVRTGQWQVSPGGGIQAIWAHSGRELFYRALDGTVMSVPVRPLGQAWSAAPAVPLFKDSYYGGVSNFNRQYDIAPDDRRFVMIKQGGDDGAAPQNITLVLNWFEELKRLVPAN